LQDAASRRPSSSAAASSLHFSSRQLRRLDDCSRRSNTLTCNMYQAKPRKIPQRGRF
jgi:hypothetical protein